MIVYNYYSTNNVDKSYYVKFVSNLQSYFKQLFITQIRTIVNRILCLITPTYKNWLSVYLI